MGIRGLGSTVGVRKRSRRSGNSCQRICRRASRPKQLRVLRLAAGGASNPAITRQLGIGVTTAQRRLRAGLSALQLV